MKNLQSKKVRGWILFPPTIIYVIVMILTFIHVFTGIFESIKTIIVIVGSISFLWIILGVIFIGMADFEKYRNQIG